MSHHQGQGAAFSPVDAPLKQKKKLLNGPHFEFTYPNGSVYQGAFKDGKLHGFGVYRYRPSGDLYEGEWKADMKHGQGRYSFAGGDTYVGTWYMGKKHGKGKFTFASGDEYYGSWKSDVMDGYGVFRLERNGDQYEGFWVRGLREGAGVLRSGAGNIYDGMWANGKEEGLGILQDVNGSTYCGTWKAGAKDGKGVEQEKGLTFLVEYVGGYLISKQPHQSDRHCPDETWEGLLTLLHTWTPPPPLTTYPKGIHEVLESEELQALKRTLDSWRTAYLALFERVCEEHLSATENGNGSDVKQQHGNVTALSANEKIIIEAKHDSELLRGRVQLLEAALGERMLESRRVHDELREKDIAIQELKFQLAKQRGGRKKSFVNPEQGVDTALNHKDNDDTHFPDGGSPDLEETAKIIADLQKQNVTLSQANYTQQQKLTVLSAENTHLSGDVLVLEERVKELEAMVAAGLAAETKEAPSIDGADASGAEKTLSAKPSRRPSGEEMSEAEVRKQLREIRERNAELLVENSRLEKDISEARRETATLTKQLKEAGDRRSAAVEQAVSAAKEASERAMREQEAGSTTVFQAAPPPEWESDVKRDTADTNRIIKNSLLEKEEHITQLQKENAKLSRMLEEYRFATEFSTKERPYEDGSDSIGAAKKRKGHRSRSLEKSGPAHQQKDTGDDSVPSAETEKLASDLKKSKKKLKKLVDERNELALELYNTQCNLARLNRVPLHLRGQLVVAVLLQPPRSPTEPQTDTRSLVTIKESDPTQIEVSGVSRPFHYDVCFASPTTPEHVFLDVKGSLSFAAQGFQAGFVGFGSCHSASRNALADLLPFLVEGLRSECTVHEQGRMPRRVAFRVAAVEIDSDGMRDSFSGKTLPGIDRDTYGYVTPRSVSFTDCSAERVVDFLKQPLSSHTQPNRLSHLWMQVQVTVTSVAEQTVCCGRLTMLDIAGITAADEFDGFDAASTRFMKRSLRHIDDLLSAMHTDTNTIPFSSSPECSLLYDLLGGNSMTTVIGSVPSLSVEGKEQLLSGLAALESIGKLRNGPFLQDYTSADALRWRDIVSAVSSAEQSHPAREPVADVSV